MMTRKGKPESWTTGASLVPEFTGVSLVLGSMAKSGTHFSSSMNWESLYALLGLRRRMTEMMRNSHFTLFNRSFLNYVLSFNRNPEGFPIFNLLLGILNFCEGIFICR